MKCYSCQKPLPPNATKCPSCGQPVYTTSQSPNMVKGRRLDGCLMEEPSASDFRAVPNLTSLPSKVDLRPDCSPIEDQGQVGSCVANAVVGAMEYQFRKTGKPPIDLSRMFVYFNARRMSGCEQDDCGTTIASGMAAFLAFGAPPETIWPYDPNLVARVPDQGAYDQALSNVPTEYARVTGVENVKGALARNCPVVFAASLPERCYAEAGRTGVVPTPTEDELAAIRTRNGRHALLLVGYDLTEGVFHVRNSWGTNWGSQGYCKIGIDAWEAATAANTTWILGKLDGDFTVSRPKLISKEVQGSVAGTAGKLRDDIRSGLATDMQSALKDIKDRMNPRRNG